MEEKVCRTCGKEKPLNQFSWRSKQNLKVGRHTVCKKCRRAYFKQRWKTSPESRSPELRRHRWLWRKHGISLTDYEWLLEVHGGRCRICRRLPPEGTWLAVDHEHSTGHIRGLLCHECNAGLGFFRDNPKLLGRAIQYLDEAGRSGPIIMPRDKARVRADWKARGR